MFGVGFLEIVVIALVALIFIGPKRLPEVAKQFGRFFVQFKRITNEVRSTVDNVVHQAEEDLRREQREALQQILTNPPKSDAAVIEAESYHAGASPNEPVANFDHENINKTDDTITKPT